MNKFYKKARLLTCGLVSSSLILSSLASGSDGSGLQTSVAVDIVTDLGMHKESTAGDKMEARETEVMLYGPIDHLFDGALSLAAHPEGGESFFEIHEAYIGSTKLIPRTRFKIGKFFLGIGRLNQIHRHDWPFIMAPEIHRIIIAETSQRSAEGTDDTGAEVSVLLPLPFYLDLTVGATNGFTYGHSHEEGERPRVLTHYGRLATYFETGSIGWKTGFSYLKRVDSLNNGMVLTGWDLIGKLRRPQGLVFMFQSEAWVQTLTPPDADKQQVAGAYAYPQFGVAKGISVGTRLDYTTVLTKEDLNGKKIANNFSGIEPNVTYKSSEFATFRVGFQFQQNTPGGEEDRTINKSFLAQSTFILGAHPAHDF